MDSSTSLQGTGECLFNKGKALIGHLVKLNEPSDPPVNECLPYKSLADVLDFLELVMKNNLPAWLERTGKLIPATSYCFPQSEMLRDDRRAMLRRTTPKTMVCHDYKGGYLKDRYVDYNWEGQGEYIFTQWSLIDSFVYFSHYLVTVPPPCWINAGHSHGVLVLGTLITEGKHGRDFWDLILASEENWTWFAEVLSLICRVHRFDGYLLNVESPLHPEQVSKLLDFIKLLKSSLPKSCKVVWYDSVTDKGQLSWQNHLNAFNYIFFDLCDGIYLNYGYQRWQLEKSADLAGGRRQDVYVGIDVFGRGCPGSGFFCSDAASMARDNGLSIAIFAPGWTEEAAPGDPRRNNEIFWSSLSRYLYVHGTASTSNPTLVLLGGKQFGTKNWNQFTGETSENVFSWEGPQGLVQLALLPPTQDERTGHKALLNLQAAVVTYNQLDIRKYYSQFPVPLVAVSETDNVTLIVDTRTEVNSLKIPLMLFEVDIKHGVEVSIEARGHGTIRGYVLVESKDSTTQWEFDVPMNVDYESVGKITKQYSGKLLEVGVKTVAKSIAYISSVKITTS